MLCGRHANRLGLGQATTCRHLHVLTHPRVVSHACTSSSVASTSGRHPRSQDAPCSRCVRVRAATRAEDVSTGSSQANLAADPKVLRRLLLATTAAEALELMLQQPGASQNISPQDAQLLLSSSLEQGNVALALSIYRDMCLAKQAHSQRSSNSSSPWPSADLDTTAAVVLGLCRQLRVNDAIQVMESIRSQGVPKAEEVSFGKVVNSPLAPKTPLTVVAPQEGNKVVADAASRYEFETYSGTIISCSSEALSPSSNPLLAVGRALGLVKSLPAAAVHEMVLQAPDGTSRTFRFSTATADVPGQKGERVTVVCAPSRGSSSKLRRLLLSTSPPRTKPGQAMAATNHKTGAELQLLEPPLSTAQGGIPSWVVPVAVVLAGGDAASGLLDPVLPAVITTSALVLAGSAVAGNTMLLPRLKQLPPNSVKLESMRQELLAKHSGLNTKVGATLQEAVEDVRTLAKLWQLQVKMQSVGSGSSSAYEARIQRITSARAALEQRLIKRLELLDGYARVMNMIEIEVEMELQVPAEELAGIEQQMVKLEELEEMRQEWQVAAEAQDEVEKLLRTTSLPTLPSA